MKKTIVSSLLFFYMAQPFAQFKQTPLPVAEKKEHWRTLHGDKVLDNYYWMYDYF